MSRNNRDNNCSWCGPCKMISPILDRVSKESKVKLVKVNVDDNARTAAEHQISALPTVVGFKNGQEQERFMGVRDEKFIATFATKLQSE